MKDSIYIHQPPSCRMPLPARDYTGTDWIKYVSEKRPHMLRVLGFDPSAVYARIEESDLAASPYSRFNKLNMEVLFPSIKGHCACGCGGQLSGRQKRWASKVCSDFAVAVWSILANWSGTLPTYIFKHYGCACANCGEMYCALEIDHIVPVHLGGGMCWLSNYQPLCKSCHKDKTKQQMHGTYTHPCLV